MQFTLPLKINKKEYLIEDFIVTDEVKVVFDVLNIFFKQENFDSAQFPNLILKGKSQSGKTHLLNIFANDANCKIIDASKLTKENLSNFLQNSRFCILENIDEILSEELLLNSINLAKEREIFLLLTAKEVINSKIKDLNSRLRNIFEVEILDPSTETIKYLLVNYFAKKQLRFSGQIIDFIAENINRDYASIINAVSVIEQENAKLNRIIKLEEVRNLLSKAT